MTRVSAKGVLVSWVTTDFRQLWSICPSSRWWRGVLRNLCLLMTRLSSLCPAYWMRLLLNSMISRASTWSRTRWAALGKKAVGMSEGGGGRGEGYTNTPPGPASSGGWPWPSRWCWPPCCSCRGCASPSVVITLVPYLSHHTSNL